MSRSAVLAVVFLLASGMAVPTPLGALSGISSSAAAQVSEVESQGIELHFPGTFQHPSRSLRTEVEVFRQDTSEPVFNGSTRSSSIMLNSLYRVRIDGGITSFVGAGIGAISRQETIPGHTMASQWTPAVQFRSGLTYELSQALSGIVEYRLQAGGGPSFLLGGASTKLEFKHKGFVLGLTYRLN